MDWEKYAKNLEEIISSLDLPHQTRVLVDGLVEHFKNKCKKSSC